jgi:cbb3-type cytochrome oxidase maturation protein
MNILLVMIPISILLLIGAGIAFFWAVDHDQFDDLDTPRLLPLLDDPDAPAGTPADAPAGAEQANSGTEP